MLNSDDKQFEAYLKNFRPVAPVALSETSHHRYKSIRSIALWGSIAASVAILITGIVFWHTRTPYRGADRRVPEPVSVNGEPPLPPLTVDSANRWLGTAPSVDAALDSLTFRAKDAPIPANKQSAIAVLAEEKARL